MQRLYISKILSSFYNQHTKSRLTIGRLYGHNLHNTPTKPMPFSNSMLKLSGLFFAYHLVVITHNLLLVSFPLLNNRLAE